MVSTQISATTGTMGVTPTQGVKKTSRAENIAFDFGQMMNQSLNDLTQQKTPEFSEKGSKDVSFGAQSTTGASKIKNVSDSKPQKTERSQKAGQEKTGEPQEVMAEDKVETDPQTAAEQATQTEGLRDKIKETLGVTDEQIEAALEALGFSVEELFDSEKLTQFVVQITGNDSTLDLLTDNAFSQGLFELQNFVAQVEEESRQPLAIAEERAPEPVVSKGVTEEEIPEESKKKAPVQAEKAQKAEMVSTEETAEKTPKVTITDNRTDGKNQASADSDKKDHSSGERHDATQVFVNNLGSAVESVMSVANSQGVDNYTAISIVNQIVDAARVTLNEQVSTMEMMLNPENLGKVALSVSLKEGIVTAQIVTENENAKDAIESQILMLKEQLNNQGLKVEAVEVTVASHSFEAGYYGQNPQEQAQTEENNNRKGSGTKRIDLSQLTEETIEELDEGDRITAQMMANDGNMVNYQA